MKHCLLTWYGMTDLALPWGSKTRRVLISALKTGDYSNVVSLAYTNPGKEQRGFDNGLRGEWEEWSNHSSRKPVAPVS